ncbi:MAG: hypothetical protein L0I76_37610, partial [Pseudonocardia sp.]|nr:hypothetical protein [Pseudonocardia sp.]
MTGARPPAPMPVPVVAVPVVPVVAVPVVPVVAVQVGTTATRLAAPGADGRPELVATLPAGTSASSALESLYGDASVPVVVLVHPSGRDADEVRVDAAELRAAAGTVRTVPAPVSVLAGTRDAAPPASDVSGGRPEGVLGGRSDPWTGASAGPEPVREAGSRVSVTPRLPMTPTAALASLSPVVGPGTVPVAAPVLVVDVGASGTELTVVVGERAMPAHRMDVGGDRLDAALGAATGVGPARARAVRESLSLRTEVVLPGGDRCDADRCREVIRPVLVGLAAAVAGVARRGRAPGGGGGGGLARPPPMGARRAP